MKNLLKNKYTILVLTLILGGLIGWLIKPSNQQTNELSDHQNIKSSNHQLWTCSMHPQIRQDHPGNCPICGMELVPLNDGGETVLGAGEIRMSNEAMKIAEVQTSLVEKTTPYKEVYLPGKVKADERQIASITSRFSGRIEKLYVSFTGQKVRKGTRLATIYSPDLVTAQKELFEAKKFENTNPSFYQAALNKLKLWDLTDKQIEAILQKSEPQFYFDVLAPQSGTVTDRVVTQGDYVKEGSELFKIANFGRVWVMFDAYEIDLPWIKTGDKIHLTVKSLPNEEFTSTVTFIDPVINPQTRVASIRTEINNSGGKLKPEMFATGILKANLPGKEQALIIPKTSILWTGKRAVVYVKKPEDDHIFSYREIELGPQTGDFYVVKNGLLEGEEIATNGVFKIDAAAQLQSKQSMMNPEGGKVSTGHNHGNMTDMKAEVSPEEIHEGHNSPAENSSEQMDMAVNDKFKGQFTAVFEKYLNVKDALVASDLSKAKSAGSAMSSQLEKVDMTLVKGNMHQHWMATLGKLNGSLTEVRQGQSLDQVRKSFMDLSDELFSAIKMFGLKGDTAYYQFCPMVNGNKGGYWLSQFKEIKNPYFGEAMLTCGETKEILK